jgi:hypothetical protein
MSNDSPNVRYFNNKAYIRYSNGNIYLCTPNSLGTDECIECCPNTFATLWEHPNIACSNPRITHPIDLSKPYWHFPSGNTNGQVNLVPAQGFSALCGTPPQTNLSSRIEIKIPYDSIFSGTYVFDWRQGNWNYQSSLSKTSLSPYPDAGSSYYNQILVSLTETSGEPTYKGYVEAARQTTHTSNLSGVFAYPAQFVFTAMQAPVDAASQSPFPTGSGHRAVVGFALPIRWRHEYNDWVVVDSVGHKISGTKTSNAANTNWLPSTDCFPSGYATSRSGPYTVGLSGITNSPATYNLSNTTTAITGSCTGLAHLGFSYRTSASGLPFDSTTYDTKLVNFSGIRPKFGGAISHGASNINQLRLFEPKTPMESWLTFTFSCRTSGTTCNEFDYITPVSTGSTSISATCLGSYINADFVCIDSKARPSGDYFITEGVSGLKVVYSGLPENIYPLVKTNSSTAKLFKAGSGQMVFVDYNGASTPEALRNWINKEFNFVKTDVNNSVTYSYPGVDLYWDLKESVIVSGVDAVNRGLDGIYYLANGLDAGLLYYSKDAGNTYPRILMDGGLWVLNDNTTSHFVLESVSYPNIPVGTWGDYDSFIASPPLTSANNKTAFARLIPCDSAAFESPLPGIYLISVDGKFGSDPTASDLIGAYGHDSTTGRYINVNNGNGNYQMRFITNKWHLGKIESGNFVTYYVLEYLTGGIPSSLITSAFLDYTNYLPPSDYTWNNLKIPVTCKSAPIGEWTSAGYSGTGVAASIKDPIPTAWNAGNTCGA